MSIIAKKKDVSIRHAGGLEGTLDVVAWIAFVLGIVSAAIPMLLMVGENSGAAWIHLLSGCFYAFIVLILFRSLAEIIRLLKKQAGLNYGGKISEGKEVWGAVYVCVKCGATLNDEHRCKACERTLVSEIQDQD